MPKIHDDEREQRITDEVIVDCYDEAEERMGWFYYMYDGLAFPIMGQANMPISGGKTALKKIKIVGIDPKAENGSKIRIGVIVNGTRELIHISPEYLDRIETSDENLDIINDWLYWHDFDLL